MSFRRFIKACRKYGFYYELNTNYKNVVILRPKNTFENIRLEFPYPEYRKMFKKAVKTMKTYSTSHNSRR